MSSAISTYSTPVYTAIRDLFHSLSPRERQITLLAIAVLACLAIFFTLKYFFRARVVPIQPLPERDEHGVLNGVGERTIKIGNDQYCVMEGTFEMGKLNGEGEKKRLVGDTVISREKGRFVNGKLHGPEGEEWNQDGTRFIGHFQDGLLHGPGKILTPEQHDQIGTFEKGQLIEGWKKCFNADVEEGTFDKKGRLDGNPCTRTCANGKIEHGLFRKGKFESSENEERTFPDGTIATGTFLKGCLEGRGVMTLANGEVREGTFHHNILVKGKKSWTDAEGTQNIWEGCFEMDPQLDYEVLHGPGEKRWITSDGVTRFNGTFIYGKMNGNGFKSFPSGVREEGTFVDDVLTIKEGQL